MSVSSEEVLSLRTATIDDLDDVIDLACATFPMDPQWDYRFPHRKEFPEDHWKCTRLAYQNLMETPGNVMNIITIPTKKDGKIVDRPIAVAVWELPGDKTGVIPTQAGNEGRRDADPKRMKVYSETIMQARKKWFVDEYGSKKLHLRVLGTHPDYQRHGAGTQHCKWGVKLAQEHKVPITLFAGPLGQGLYSHIGFTLLANLTIQVEGEEEKMSMGVMIYKESC